MTDYGSFDKWIQKSKLLAEGILRPNRFKVEMTYPQGMSQSSKALGEEYATFRIMSAQVSNIGMDSGKLDINQVTINYYKQRSDMDLSLGFIDTSDLKLREFFNKWMRIGYDADTRVRGYTNDLKCAFIKIFPLDETGKASSKHDIFYDCIPFEISDINYDMGQENSYVKTEVKFKFVVHEIEG